MDYGLKLYEHLLAFSVYRRENDDKLQQVLYTDMVTYLKKDPPKNDEEAISTVYLLVARLLYTVHDMPSSLPVYEQFHEEVREILAIMVHYKPKE